MGKSWEEMNITELKAERERVRGVIKTTKDERLKKQYQEYILKIANEIKYYEKHFGLEKGIKNNGNKNYKL